MIILDQIQSPAVTRSIIEILPNQTLETDTIQMIVLFKQILFKKENHQIIEIAIIQTIEIDIILITYHETTLTIAQIKTITTIELVIIPGTDTTIPK